MRALGFNQHGTIEQLRLLELPQPKPAPDEVLLQIKASAFNHLDLWVLQGWPGLNLALPHICGSDAAGVIVECGKKVTDFSVGDRVAVDPGVNLYDDEFTARGEHSVSPGYRILGEQLPGTHAEYQVIPAKNLIKIPNHISFEVAAASGLVTTTAWRMLIHRARIQAGETVLIIGAGGGVNSMAIQIAKLAGATVYATTSTDEKLSKAKTLGADIVVNYNTERDWAQRLLQFTNKKGFDIVVDNVGHATLKTSMRLAKQGGRIVIVGNTSGPMIEIDIRYIFGKQISLIGSTMGNHFDYLQAMQMVFAGKIAPPIHTVLPLEEGIAAMTLLEQQQQFGKIVLKM
jgi:NADPH:quinone reductase-like Zn-dependent oxidoreductase